MKTPLKTLFLMLLAGGLVAGLGGAARGADTGFHITFKQGTMDATANDETLFTKLEAEHGKLQNGRQVNPMGVELDFLMFTGPHSGVGFGVESTQYQKTFQFRGSGLPVEDLSLSARSLIYTLKMYARLGTLYPYLALGSGNYYIRYTEKTGNVSFLDSAPRVLTGRVGFRWMWGAIGIMAEGGQTLATLPVRTRTDRATVELGGAFVQTGITLGW